jgi:hypothetical protein
MTDGPDVDVFIAGNVRSVAAPADRPRRIEGPIADLAEGQHGVVARRQLLDLGFPGTAVDSRVRRAALLPVHRGVYAVGHRRLTMEGRWMAAVLAAGPDAVLSHRSAGQLWGILPRSGTVPEVTAPRQLRTRPRICAHMYRVVGDEVELVEGIPTTSVSRTLLDLAALLDPPALERAMNEAGVLHLTSRVSPQELLDRYPRRPGSGALRRLLDEGASSRGVTKRELEARFAAVLDAHGVPAPRRNADIAVRGRFFNVDCLWGPQRVIAELDGRAVHGTDRAFEGDRHRDRLLVADGWRIMRVTWAQLRDEPAAVVDDLTSLLALSAP